MSGDVKEHRFESGGLRGKLGRANLWILALTGAGAITGVLTVELKLANQHQESLERAMRETLTTRGSSLTSSQATLFRSLVADNAVLEVQLTIAKTIEAYPNVVYGAYIDEAGKTWGYCSPASPCNARSPDDEFPIHNTDEVRKALELSKENPRLARLTIREGTFFRTPVMEFAEPVRVDGEQVGILRYGVSTVPLLADLLAARKAQLSLTLQTTASLGLTLIAAIFAGIYFSRKIADRITKPLSDLTKAAENIALGEKAVQVSIRSGDELEVLGDAFNRMASDLERSYEALEAKNRELQNEIDERRAAQNERTELRNHLIQAQKMEAFGQLAGGVAHDFNNILAVVIGNSELAGQFLDDGAPLSEIRPFVQDIAAAADRGANLTKQLLTFSRRESDNPRIVNLNDTVHVFSKLIRRVLQESVELRIEVAETLAPVHIDPGRMEQVLMNLCVNARDAMPDGGQITLRTREQILSEVLHLPTGPLEPGHYVVLSASDTGTGIADGVLGRVFEPFFTTKGAGQGTGLGLAMVHSIVQAAGGGIGIESKEGLGTTFHIYLPAHTVAEGYEVPLESTAVHSGRGRRILICEDETPVRQMTKRMLERCGYSVVEASTPKVALERLNERNVDLLLTDVVMPGMNGKELADAAHKLVPDLPVLYVSGYTAGILSANGISDDSVCFLRKPFRTKELLLRIEELIDQRDEARQSAV